MHGDKRVANKISNSKNSTAEYQQPESKDNDSKWLPGLKRVKLRSHKHKAAFPFFYRHKSPALNL